jgi:flavin-dependent dehydrogenase
VIKEYFLGQEKIEEVLGTSMHVFLLDIPRLEFAAIIPKGDYASLCLLGDDIDNELLNEFLNTPEVRDCFPSDIDFDNASCWCAPRINTSGAKQPSADRIVFIGDSGSTRLYKDGIGAAYRTAKAAATTAIFQGISAEDFEEHFWPACKNIENDNRIGKVIFLVTRLIQSSRFARRAVLRMTKKEQSRLDVERRMSMVLWDMFTGSSPYRDIFVRTIRPTFLFRLFRELAVSVIP